MTPIKLIIVEDEPLIAADLNNQLGRKGFVIEGMFESGEELIEHLTQNDLPDLILMDIQLEGEIDGIDTAHQLNTKYEIPIIFLTSNTDDATFKRAKISFPHSYLSKPFRINDVVHAIELAVEENNSDNDESIEYLADRVFIRSNNGLEKVLYEDILYFEADGAYTKIKTKDKEYLLSQTLKKSEERLISKSFIKIHRSYIINVKNVDRISEGYVYLSENKIPISRSNKEELLNKFRTL